MAILLILAAAAPAEPGPAVSSVPEASESGPTTVEKAAPSSISAPIDTEEPASEPPANAVKSISAVTAEEPSASSADPGMVAPPSTTANNPPLSEASGQATTKPATNAVTGATDRASDAVRTVIQDSAATDPEAIVDRTRHSIPATTSVLPDLPVPVGATTTVLRSTLDADRFVEIGEEVVGGAVASVGTTADLSDLAPLHTSQPHDGTLSPATAAAAAPAGPQVPLGGLHLSAGPAFGPGKADVTKMEMLVRSPLGIPRSEIWTFGPRLGPHGVRENLGGPHPPAVVESPGVSLGPEGSLEGSGDRIPVNLPGPMPEAPATFAGSSGSSFVPLVALLALLALVAPAVRRRLRVVPAFRAPTPFTCALERPG
ncbi:MAG: hypothetical protein ACRDLL_11465 [Solirubrobacterales bacterium]